MKQRRGGAKKEHRQVKQGPELEGKPQNARLGDTYRRPGRPG